MSDRANGSSGISRRELLAKGAAVAGAAAGLGVLLRRPSVALGKQAREAAPGPGREPIRLFCFDVNWSRQGGGVRPSRPEDWAKIDPKQYLDFHLDMGNNAILLHAYAFGGYAFYPSKLGPTAPAPGDTFLPRLFALCRKAKVPFWTYFCVGTDVAVIQKRRDWVIPKSTGYGFVGPETGWTDLLCERIEECLKACPADWVLFDWFVYGDLKPNFRLQPAAFVAKPFAEIIGRPMPKSAAQITPAEGLKYRREVLARQFRRIRQAVRKVSPKTKIIFNVPYWRAAEPLWVNHPMLNESDGLFAESTRPEVVNWLLKVRKPDQRVMTTILGRVDDEPCDPASWRKWQEKGCDFYAYARGTPPKFKVHPSYNAGLAVVRKAFHAMKAEAR